MFFCSFLFEGTKSKRSHKTVGINVFPTIRKYGNTLMQAAEMPEVLCVSLDPGTVDTKMLRTGWEGCYGIPLQQADDTFWIATSPVRYAERLERLD